MTVCTAPDCGHPAVLQWQRHATPAEAAAAVNTLQEPQQRIHGHRHTNATLHLLQTRQQLDTATEAAHAGDQRAARILPDLRERVADAERDVTRLETAGPDRIDPPADVTVAVFGCTVHAVSDDAATWTHQTTCLTDPAGECVCTPPAPTE